MQTTLTNHKTFAFSFQSLLVIGIQWRWFLFKGYFTIIMIIIIIIIIIIQIIMTPTIVIIILIGILFL